MPLEIQFKGRVPENTINAPHHPDVKDVTLISLDFVRSRLRHEKNFQTYEI